jgi:hypothetical protein
MLTLSAKLLSDIARSLDDDNYVMVASLDQSSASDLVNIRLLMKRLTIIGLPNDVIQLIKVRLTNRSYYVSIDGNNSMLFDLLLGTVQGSILGPVLYAILVSPLFILEDLDSFADDTFIQSIDKNINTVITNIEKSIEVITKWLRHTGLIVN